MEVCIAFRFFNKDYFITERILKKVDMAFILNMSESLS